MNLPLQTLDARLLARAEELLDDEWLGRDADLAPVLPLVLARGVGRDWHKAGTFRHHLVGVARTLSLWQQPSDVRLLGLLHSVYGNAHVDLVKFDPARERERLRAAVGERAEHLVYRFCTISRPQLVRKLLAGDIAADGSIELVAADGGADRVPATDVAAFAVVTMADSAEQWFSWQEDIYAGFPSLTERDASVHWAAALWPGPMRPASSMYAQVSRIGAALRHPALAALLPAPPVFGMCQQVLTEQNEASAAALYWSVITQDMPLVRPDAAIATLEQAVRCNPWVGEPQMVLAQLYLTTGRHADAARAAASALQLMCGWGNAWDKRVQWDAWIAWTRILLQGANTAEWPSALDKLNNVALKMDAA